LRNRSCDSCDPLGPQSLNTDEVKGKEKERKNNTDNNKHTNKENTHDKRKIATIYNIDSRSRTRKIGETMR